MMTFGCWAAVIAAMVAVTFQPSAAIIDNAKRIDMVYELADVALARLLAHNCYESYEPVKCDQLTDTSAKDLRLYFGGLLPNNDTVVAVLPDNEARLTTKPHDAFIVFDPFPAYKFGHPIYMFYVDVNVTTWKCEDIEGIHTSILCKTHFHNILYINILFFYTHTYI